MSIVSVTAPTKLYKQPAELRTYSMDFTGLLGDSETISSITSVTSEKVGGGVSDLVIGSASLYAGNTKVLFDISGGIHKNTYRIEVIVETSDSHILEGDGLLVVTNS